MYTNDITLNCPNGLCPQGHINFFPVAGSLAKLHQLNSDALAPTRLGSMVTWVAASNRAKNCLSDSPLQSSPEYLDGWV